MEELRKITTSGERIKELIRSFKMSQTDFCKRTGIQKSALSNYIHGQREPRQEQISKIAEAFHINPSWLLGYDVPFQITFRGDDDIVTFSNLFNSSIQDEDTRVIAAYHAADEATKDIICKILDIKRGPINDEEN